MARILVEFNATMQDVEQGSKRVTPGRDEDVASGDLPVLRLAERSIAADGDRQVEGMVAHQAPFWLAALDWQTLTCLAPAR